MTKRRLGGAGLNAAPPKPAPVHRLSTSWPPAAFSIHATLVQPACVKCRIECDTVRQIRYLAKPHRPVAEDCATVCDECWAIVESALPEYRQNLSKAFWETKPVERSSDTVLVDLVEFSPHRKTTELWRKFREDRRRIRRIRRRRAPTD